MRVLSFFILFFCLIVTSSAQADKLTVTDPNDSGQAGQLRTLINQAKDGDTISIPEGMTVMIQKSGVEDDNKTGDFDINKHLTIGGFGPSKSAIQGNSDSRIFDVLENGSLEIYNLTLKSGNSTNGGAIRNRGKLDVNSVHFTQNKALVTGNNTAQGGAIYQASGESTIAFSSFTQNTSDLYGGAIYIAGGKFLIGSSNLSENSAAQLGGAILSEAAGDIHLNFVTIANNKAASGGALWGTIHVKNSIVAHNTPDNVAGPVISEGYNLISDSATSAFNQSGDQINTDPKLLPLTDHFFLYPPNDAPIEKELEIPYYPIGIDSPAVDKGQCDSPPPSITETVLRPSGAGCDIGAFEVWQPIQKNQNPQDANPTQSSGGSCQLNTQANSPIFKNFLLYCLLGLNSFFLFRKMRA